MNTKIIVAMLLLVFGSMSFALVDAFWVSPTPANDSEYWGDSFEIVMNASSPMDDNNFIEINGVNKTCDVAVGNLSCNYTMPYSEKSYNTTYTIKGYANVSSMYRETNETRLIYYVGCGQISGDQTLLQDVGSSVYPDIDCFTISANNTSINCEGYTITQDNDTSSNAFYAINKYNIVIEDCVFESGYRAISFNNVNYSTITNNIFNNQTWDVIAFDYSNENNITYNDFNMDVASQDDVYGFNCVANCNGNNLFYNNMSNGALGIDVEGNDTQIWRNNIYNMDDECIRIDGFSIGGGNTISDNEIYNCDVGIDTEDVTTLILAYNHIYNTSGAMYFSNTEDVNLTYMGITNELDRPAGGYINYSSVSMLDIMLPNSAYYLDWAPVAVTPSGRGSFLGKQIGCSAAPEGVNYNVTLIDVIGFTWTNGEVSGYDETQIELWGIDVNGTAVLLNDTPGTGTNSIATYNFRMQDYDSLGLYYHGSTPTSSDALSQMIIILVLGIIIVILAVVVPTAMGFTVDAGPVMTLIGLAVMVVLVYNYIIGAI